LSPLGIDAAVKALKAQTSETSAAQRQFELALQQARFSAAHARRQYDAVDPANRLVAGELERRWNEALQVAQRIEGEIAGLEASKQAPLGEKERQHLMQLGSDLDLAWSHPAATAATRKRIFARTWLPMYLICRGRGNGSPRRRAAVTYASAFGRFFGIATAMPVCWKPPSTMREPGSAATNGGKESRDSANASALPFRSMSTASSTDIAALIVVFFSDRPAFGRLLLTTAPQRIAVRGARIMIDPTAIRRPAISSETFATLGENRLAYIKEIRSEEVAFLYAEAPLLAPGHQVFVLHAADGSPLLVAESREAAIADAENNQLQTVSVH
jgi:hypothetical protein